MKNTTSDISCTLRLTGTVEKLLMWLVKKMQQSKTNMKLTQISSVIYMFHVWMCNFPLHCSIHLSPYPYSYLTLHESHKDTQWFRFEFMCGKWNIFHFEFSFHCIPSSIHIYTQPHPHTRYSQFIGWYSNWENVTWNRNVVIESRTVEKYWIAWQNYRC